MFNFYQAVLEATIEAAKKDGKYDDGIVDVSGSSCAARRGTADRPHGAPSGKQSWSLS